MVEKGANSQFTNVQKFYETVMAKMPKDSKEEIKKFEEFKFQVACIEPPENVEDFECIICIQLLRDVFTQCNKCEKLFDNECLNNWLERNKSCPFCRETPFIKRENRIAKTQLDSFKLM